MLLSSLPDQYQRSNQEITFKPSQRRKVKSLHVSVPTIIAPNFSSTSRPPPTSFQIIHTTTLSGGPK
jgi:hypothetical protein